MSGQIGINNYNGKENSNQEDYFFRFENALIPIIPTFAIIIIAILFNKYSSKSKKNFKNLINKKGENNPEKKGENKINKKNSCKRSLVGGNPRYKQDKNKSEKNIKKQKKEEETLESLVKSPFFMDFFKSIYKQKGFDGKNIENLFNEDLNKRKMEKYFFMDNHNSIRKFKIIENVDFNNKNNILLYYLDENKNENEDIFNKNDFINEYEIIIINYDSKEIKLIFPKSKNIKKLSDEELLKVIKNSWCINNIYNIFKINPEYKIGLYINKIENKYNVYLINNYITTKKIEKNSEEKNDNYVINNIEANKSINTSSINTQASINSNQNVSDKNEIIDNSNNIIIINEDKNNINQNQNQYQNQNQNVINNNYNINNNNNFNTNQNIYANNQNNYNNSQNNYNNSQNNYYNSQNNYNNAQITNNNYQNNYNNNQIVNNNYQNNYNNNYQSNNNNIQNNYNNNQNNQNNNNNQTNNNNQNNNNMNMIYIFPLVGLNNVGSTCFMNATLQCLLHVSELNSYFLNEYPNDYKVLNTKNAFAESKGNISLSYFYVVQGVYMQNLNYFNNSYTSGTFAPREFKETLGKYNSQFQFYEANDSKDLILYLLQTFHEELNYFGDKSFPVNIMRPNQENRVDTFNYFMTTYNAQNFSIISKLFYGTYENTIKCLNCNRVYFSYQKFEFISFSTYNYRNSEFNIYNGFRDNQVIQYLKGDNQYYCPNCQCLHDGETCCKIIQPPSKLLINIDYGKNKVFKVRRLIFDEIIDVTQFVNFDFGKKILYQISGVCTHLGSSGPSGHYIAYCKNRQTGLWYNFNDSYVRQCNKDEIYNGSPYLLLYEQI